MEWLKTYGFPSDAIDTRIFKDVSPLEKGMILAVTQQYIQLPAGPLLLYVEDPFSDIRLQQAFIWDFLISHYRDDARMLVKRVSAELEEHEDLSDAPKSVVRKKFERLRGVLNNALEEPRVGYVVLDQLAGQEGYKHLTLLDEVPFIHDLLHTSETDPRFEDYLNSYLIPDTFRKISEERLEPVLSARYAN